MAQPTEVNTQITDAVTQTNVKVLEEAPAQAMGEIYQENSQVIANVLEEKHNPENPATAPQA